MFCEIQQNPWSTFETKVVENPDKEKEVTTENAALVWGNGTELCDATMTTIELGKLKIANIFEPGTAQFGPMRKSR